MLLPLPDAFDQFRAPQVMSGLTLQVTDAFFNNCLRGDARVVGSGNPAGVEAAGAVLPGEDVLQGVVEGMAKVQRPGHIGRRNNHAKWWLAHSGFGREDVQAIPQIQTVFLRLARIKRLG